MTNNMRALTPKVDKDAPVRFVSISVDPARDTPAVLAAIREARPQRSALDVPHRRPRRHRRPLRERLQARRRRSRCPAASRSCTARKFAVADKQGVIRGYYDAMDGTVPEEVAEVVEQLLDE